MMRAVLSPTPYRRSATPASLSKAWKTWSNLSLTERVTATSTQATKWSLSHVTLAFSNWILGLKAMAYAAPWQDSVSNSWAIFRLKCKSLWPINASLRPISATWTKRYKWRATFERRRRPFLRIGRMRNHLIASILTLNHKRMIKSQLCNKYRRSIRT